MTQSRLAAIKDKIATYETTYGRDRGSVSLLAVSKKQSLEKIREAYAQGQRLFGENYVQEAVEKVIALSDLDIEWHFIGHIQSNKSKLVAEHFHWVQSVDSEKIVRRLNEQRPDHLPPLNICLEINISDDPNKAGVTVDHALALAQFCQSQPRLRLRGLMTIPAIESKEATVADFSAMHALFTSLNEAGMGLDTLSMGMTGDFDLAIAKGSTMVRVGTGIFGERS